MIGKKVVLVTTGTKGDLNPFLAIGKGLLARGFDPIVATNLDHERAVRSLGLGFAAISPPDHPQSNRDAARFKREVKEPSREMVHAYFTDLAGQDHELVVLCRTDNFMAMACAERFDVPFGIVHLQPALVPDPEDRRGAEQDWRTRIYNGCRARNGLPPVEALADGYAKATSILSLFPHWYGAPQSAFWTAGRTVGFPFLADDLPASDHRLERFVEQWGPPIVFAPGTGVTDVEKSYADAVEICRLTGRAGVFMTPHLGEDDEGAAGRRCIVRNYVNFTHFLDRTSLIVHHGGIGTTAQAIRAGVPQIVRPVAFDQPDNAARISGLGLGAVAEAGSCPAALAAMIDNTLREDQVRKRLADAAELVAAQPAVSLACDIVERLASGSGRVPLRH